MKKCLLTLTLSIVSFGSYAQLNGSLMDALDDSKEEVRTSQSITRVKPSQITTGETMETTASCASEDQRSLPLSFVMGLLRGKDASLTPTHDPSTGNLNIFGGPMIANCNSMLDFVFHPAGNGKPHSFETKVKSCGLNECEFEVHTMISDKIVSSKKKFAPTMDGFVSCLKETGVFKDGKIEKNKIVKANFDVDQPGLTKTGDLVFVSRGPAFNNMQKVFSAKTLHKNNECYFYENIQADGFKIYSKSDVEEQVLINKANRLCNEANYQNIYNNLDSFQNISGTYYQLEEIMKNDLLDKVAKAKKEFDKAVKDGTLAKLDTSKYAQLFDDFYGLMIEKHFNDESHNSADASNKNLLVNLMKDLESAESEEDKAKIEKKIRDLTKKISKYMVKPYFEPQDYAHFISMSKKAPIKDPLWKNATLKMHKSLISLKAACQAYSVDNSSCKFSDKIDDMMEVEDLNDVISSYTEIAKSQYDKRERVLKNPDEDISEEYAEKLAACEKLKTKKVQGDAAWRAYSGQIQQQVMQQCQRKNQYASYGGWYQNKLKYCIEDGIADAKAKYIVPSSRLDLCNGMASTYKKKHDEWAKLEGYRDEYYSTGKKEKKVTKKESDLSLTEVKPPNFPSMYNPNNMPSQQMMMNLQRNPSSMMMPNQGFMPNQGYMQNQGFRPGPYYGQPQNNSGYPMMNNYNQGRYPSFFQPQQQYMGGQMMMPGQMGYLQSNPGLYNYQSNPMMMYR